MNAVVVVVVVCSDFFSCPLPIPSICMVFYFQSMAFGVHRTYFYVVVSIIMYSSNNSILHRPSGFFSEQTEAKKYILRYFLFLLTKKNENKNEMKKNKAIV